MRFLLAVAALCVAATPVSAGTTMPAWRGYAGNAQHTAPAPTRGDALAAHLWKTPVDLQPQIQDGVLFIHYASPMITSANTVLVPVKTGATDGFRIEAHLGHTGALVWQANSDFVSAPHSWVPSFPAHLTTQNRLYFASAGGTVLYRDTPDQATGTIGRAVFYGLANYRANKKAYKQHVMIDTPITADNAGNIYFGFVVTGVTPLGLSSGIARIAANGVGTWVSAANAAGDSNITQVAQNCAPAVSRDQSTIYIAVSNGTAGYLLALDSTTLASKNKARLIDPSSGEDAFVSDNSSAAPVVGPDNDVYYGVLETNIPDHNDRGWLLHFNKLLTQVKTPGSFGWDDTPSVVPASAVPSYTGPSSYLMMSKYNNYYGVGTGNGHNEIALLDPNVQQVDQYSSVEVMKEILTKESPHHDPDDPPGARYEWCINSAVVDAVGKAIYANAEDGHTYRWDLVKDVFTDIKLNAPRGEAYTPTIMGPDGTIYAINNAVLYALGTR
jgi:hypothetical protein